MNLKQKFLKIYNTLDWFKRIDERLESTGILSVQSLIQQYPGKKINSLNEIEFKVFSQWGDDGIIQWLISNMDLRNKQFIEFGVEDYIESNTRFLLMNNNWSGVIFDGSLKNIKKIQSSYYYWKYDLNAIDVFLDAENINDLILANCQNDAVDLLHIDIDGNDYWVWNAIKVITPAIVIMEYNSLFGKDRAVTIPYDKNFRRGDAHHSHLYFGASVPALVNLAKNKGYSFIGCNSAGNNAYFIKNEFLNNIIKSKTIEEGFIYSKFRESRNLSGRLTYLNYNEAKKIIKQMPVYDVISNSIVPF